MSSPPNWVQSPPSAFDIVTCYFPESQPEPDGCVKLRPALVTKVFSDPDSGEFACEVAFGTKNLKILRRVGVDLIIQNAADMNRFGLAVATRFDLDNIELLPWDEEFFGCWTGKAHPKLGTLTEDYVKEYAYLMMRRSQAE